jgi:hypothetical protein
MYEFYYTRFEASMALTFQIAAFWVLTPCTLVEELHNLYSSPNTIKMIKLDNIGGAVAHRAEKMNAYRILVGKPEGKRPLGRPRHR